MKLTVASPPESSETATRHLSSAVAVSFLHASIGVAHPTSFVSVSVVLYMQTLGVRTDYFQISPQRSDQLHDQFSWQVRMEQQIFSSFHLPDAIVLAGLRCKCSF